MLCINAAYAVMQCLFVLIQISGSRHMTLNISEMVRDRDITDMEYYRDLHIPYSRVFFISNDLE